MLNRLLLTGVLSGLMVGVLVTFIHLTTVTPIILEAETYEEKAAAAAPAHAHDAATPAAHEREAWSPDDGIERSLFTFAANVVMSVGFGLVLAAGFTLAGTTLSLGIGALWGVAGYLAFSFLPGLGLPPELPGAAAADLTARQAWWTATVAASVAGLGLLAFGKSWVLRILGIVILAAPHLVGAPHPAAGEAGAVPPELAAHFVMATMFMNAAMWVALGIAGAWLFEKFGQQRGTVLDITA